MIQGMIPEEMQSHVEDAIRKITSFMDDSRIGELVGYVALWSILKTVEESKPEFAMFRKVADRTLEELDAAN